MTDTRMSDGDGRAGERQKLGIAESQAEQEAAALGATGSRAAAGGGAASGGGAAPGGRSSGARSSVGSPMETGGKAVPSALSAERIEVTQGGVGRADAGQIAVRQGGVGRADATNISVRQGGIGLARADRIELDLGGIGAALGGEVHLRRVFARLAAARHALTMEQAGAMTVVANRVEMRPRSGAIFLFARTVEGNVRPLFDWRSGAAFGAAAGLVLAVARLLRGARR